MSNHTPGSWSFDEESEAITTHNRITSGKTRIATVTLGWAEPFESEQIANARLIAAAPELLEALKVLVENGGIGPEQMFHDARAAIKKATGENT